MNRLFLPLLLLLAAVPLRAQQFIGCRLGDQWAETPQLRAAFHVDHVDLRPSTSHAVSFRLFVVSLGYHEVYVNGTKVGDQVLQPAVSQLDKRALRAGYDISHLVREGDNELMLWLGQGWGRIYGTPAVAQAWVEKSVSDGECALVSPLASSDSTWEASPSPYGYTGTWQPMQFGGERYDARTKERWRTASTYDAGPIAISPQEFGGNRIVDTLLPQSVLTLPDSTLLLDFGRVLTGWFQLDGPPLPEGDTLRMEYLDHREAQPPFTETDLYIGDGSSDIHFSNRFHMHAFRYVKVSGLAHTPSSRQNVPAITARALQISAVDPAGGATFECSDPRLNAIHDMVKYTLSCLTFSGYMVDCPHIERMGYGGDGNSSTDALQTFWDVRPTYLNWLSAWADAMDSTGDLPYVAPAFRTGGGPYWQSFIVMAPWRTYLNYGDPQLIYQYYDQMKQWLDFVEAHSEDGILQPWPDTERRGWFLGDWAVPDSVDKGGESVLHVSSCVVSHCLAILENIARLRQRHNEARLFAHRRQEVNAAIHRHFYHPETHTYANGTPLDQCYPLLLAIPPDSATADDVKSRLIADCHGKYHNHLAVGLVGVPIFTEWCIREHQADLMATLLHQPDYPGYLHMIAHGATTTWESWGCGLPNHEDRSRVHNCYNGIGTWFYQALAGIRPDPQQPGYKHFFVDPQPVDGLSWVKATKPTPYGTIAVQIEGGTLRLSVPSGASATVFPGSPREQVVESGEWTIPLPGSEQR